MISPIFALLGCLLAAVAAEAHPRTFKLVARTAAPIFTLENGVVSFEAIHHDYMNMDNKLTTSLQNAYSNLVITQPSQFRHIGTGAVGRNLSYVAVAAQAYQAAQAAAAAVSNQTLANVTGLLNPGAILANTSVPLTPVLNSTVANTTASINATLSALNTTLTPLAANVSAPLHASWSVNGTLSNTTASAPSAPSAAVISGVPVVVAQPSAIPAVPAGLAAILRPVDGVVDTTPSDRLARRSSKSKKGHSSRSSKSSGKTKSGGVTDSVPLQKTTTANLTPFMNGNMWAGQVLIGTPAQTLTITFDTGSADLVVASNKCQLAACQSKAPYNAGASKTSKALGKSFVNTYGDGSSTSGRVFTDLVTVGDLSIKGQSINSATVIAGILAELPTDGLLGLSYRYLSSTNSNGFFGNLMAERILAANQFGLRYSLSGTSELFLGGVDKSKYTGAIEWHNVMPYLAKGREVYAYWAVTGGAAMVNGHASLTDRTFIIDSGTACIYAPDADAKAFYGQIPGAGPCTTGICAGSTDLYQFPCKSSKDVPNVSFSINGGRAISLGSSFNLGLIQEGGDKCLGAVLAGSLGPTASEWLVGAVFLQHTYAAFDMGANKLGFATPAS